MKTTINRKTAKTAPKMVAHRGNRRVRPLAAASKRPLSKVHPRKILVPVDFSTCSVKALDYATAFAQPGQTEIILLHVVETIVYPIYGQEITTNYPALQTDMLETGRAHLQEFSRAKAAACSPLKLLVSEGSAWSEIVDAAKKEGADLIIISTHGRTGLGHVFMGSTAERVVRHAPCPVLVVREKEREFVS